MLTRLEVLIELKRVGIKELSLLKRECRDFEKYGAVNYDMQFSEKKDKTSIDKQAYGLGKKQVVWRVEKIPKILKPDID